MRRPATEFEAAPSPASAPVTGQPRFPVWLLALVLVAGTILAYRPVWHAGFVWDDDLHVTANPLLWEPGGLKQIWFSTSAPQYYPLVFTSFRLEYALWGARAGGYHWVNLLLHATSALLVWGVLRRLKVPGAWVAAAVFALHPVNVESVAWISERKNVLCMVFYLLSLLWYLRSEGAQDTVSAGAGAQMVKGSPAALSLESPSALFYWLSVLAFVLALLSKTAVAPLPVVLLGLAWWRRGRVMGRDLWRSAPFFGAAVALGLLTIWFEQLKTSSPGVMREDTFWSQLAGAGCAVWFYLYKAFLPIHLNYVYPRWHLNPANPLSYAPGLLLAGAFALLWRWRGRWGRAGFFCLGYYVVLLLPILGFMNIGYFNYSQVADHWQYFAILGPIALVVGGFGSMSFAMGRRRIVRVAAAVVLAILSLLTWRHSARFVDAQTLWSSTLTRNPSAWIGHLYLGNALAEKGHTDQAISEYREAIRLKPDFAAAHGNLGAVLTEKSQIDEAIIQLQEAIRLEPGYAKAHDSLGNALVRKGQIDEAISQYREAIRLKPNDPLARNNLGVALVKKGQIDEAISQHQEAIRLKSDDADGYYHLGNALAKKGQTDEAIGQFQKALHLRPDSAAAHNDLGNALARKGRMDEAISQFQEALRLKPDETDAHYNLANALFRKGQIDEAISQYEEALRLKPDDADTRNNFGVALWRKGRTEEAKRQFQEALRLKPDHADARRNLNVVPVARSDSSKQPGASTNR